MASDGIPAIQHICFLEIATRAPCAWAGATQGVDETADPQQKPAATASIFPALVLGCSMLIFAAAGVLAWSLKRSREQRYELLGQNDLTLEINDA